MKQNKSYDRIRAEVARKVIGQSEQSIDALAQTSYLHYISTQSNKTENWANLTGGAKRLFLELPPGFDGNSLARLIGQLTQSVAVSWNTETAPIVPTGGWDLVYCLLQSANFNPLLAERAIVLLKGMEGSAPLQNTKEFVQLVRGTELKKSFKGSDIAIKTSDLLWIGTAQTSPATDAGTGRDEASALADLFDQRATFKAVSTNQFHAALRKPDSILRDACEVFGVAGVQLVFSDSSLEAIAEELIDYGSLVQEFPPRLYRLLTKALREVGESPEARSVIIHRDCVVRASEPLIEDQFVPIKGCIGFESAEISRLSRPSSFRSKNAQSPTPRPQPGLPPEKELAARIDAAGWKSTSMESRQWFDEWVQGHRLSREEIIAILRVMNNSAPPMIIDELYQAFQVAGDLDPGALLSFALNRRDR